MEKNELFENMKPSKALAVMALPTIASQVIILVYNLADTWYIGRTNNPYMIAASSLALTIYLAIVALSNVFGVGGGSLMMRLVGEKKEADARKAASYSVAMAAVSAIAFSLLVLVLMNPLLKLLGASENTLVYARQYVLTTTVLGGLPTVMSMCMPQLLRNAGYSKEAGIGVGLGSLLNVALDPLFMFVLLPKGSEVLGAGIATMLSNVCSFAYFIMMYRKLREKTVLALPRRIERIAADYRRSLYSVGIPAAFAIFLYDLVTIVINRLTAAYGDIPLAAMGIVLKLERIPINVGLGVCLGMVPLIAYNYGAGNRERMKQFFSLSRIAILGFSCVCVILFWLFAKPIVAAFISDDRTVVQGAAFLKGRCLSLPFMMIGYHIVNYMNAVNQGKVSFLLAIIRHILLIIPVTVFMNMIWGLTGLTWAQLAADFLNAVIAMGIFARVDNKMLKKRS
ncbi:MAG: hypothetical protein IKH57_05640 [Clostridia bacterium]|nr:hypothetical protein [Clostridia bacterium]